MNEVLTREKVYEKLSKLIFGVRIRHCLKCLFFSSRKILLFYAGKEKPRNVQSQCAFDLSFDIEVTAMTLNRIFFIFEKRL